MLLIKKQRKKERKKERKKSSENNTPLPVPTGGGVIISSIDRDSRMNEDPTGTAEFLHSLLLPISYEI